LPRDSSLTRTVCDSKQSEGEVWRRRRRESPLGHARAKSTAKASIPRMQRGSTIITSGSITARRAAGSCLTIRPSRKQGGRVQVRRGHAGGEACAAGGDSPRL